MKPEPTPEQAAQREIYRAKCTAKMIEVQRADNERVNNLLKKITELTDVETGAFCASQIRLAGMFESNTIMAALNIVISGEHLDDKLVLRQLDELRSSGTNFTKIQALSTRVVLKRMHGADLGMRLCAMIGIAIVEQGSSFARVLQETIEGLPH